MKILRVGGFPYQVGKHGWKAFGHGMSAVSLVASCLHHLRPKHYYAGLYCCLTTGAERNGAYTAVTAVMILHVVCPRYSCSKEATAQLVLSSSLTTQQFGLPFRRIYFALFCLQQQYRRTKCKCFTAHSLSVICMAFFRPEGSIKKQISQVLNKGPPA